MRRLRHVATCELCGKCRRAWHRRMSRMSYEYNHMKRKKLATLAACRRWHGRKKPKASHDALRRKK